MNAHDIEPFAAEFRQLWDFARHATAAEQVHEGAIHLLPPSLRRLADIVEECDAYREFVHAPFWAPTPPGSFRIREALQRFLPIESSSSFHNLHMDQSDGGGPLDASQHHYKPKRPHLAYRNQGRRPIETINLFVSHED